jgi:hypothetical protein
MKTFLRLWGCLSIAAGTFQNLAHWQFILVGIGLIIFTYLLPKEKEIKIVHCSDCKYWEKESHNCNCEFFGMSNSTENDFCSRGIAKPMITYEDTIG